MELGRRSGFQGHPTSLGVLTQLFDPRPAFFRCLFCPGPRCCPQGLQARTMPEAVLLRILDKLEHQLVLILNMLDMLERLLGRAHGRLTRLDH